MTGAAASVERTAGGVSPPGRSRWSGSFECMRTAVCLYHQYFKVSPDSSPPDKLRFHMYACVHCREPLFGAETIREIYEACSDGVMTRYTVPLLADKIKKKIVRGCVCVYVCVRVCVRVCVDVSVCSKVWRESLRRDRPVGLTSPVCHACGSAKSVCPRYFIRAAETTYESRVCACA